MSLSRHNQKPEIDYSIYREMSERELDDENDYPDDNHINQKDDWLGEAFTWVKQAQKEAKKQLKELEEMNLRLDRLIEQVNEIKKENKNSRQSNVQVITMRIPIKRDRKLKRSA